jgi:hypothetical protein
MEDLLRWKSAQQAKELRERLATDGARLGRIVYARAGMRAVESWEEGFATKDLEAHKAKLKTKRVALEGRSHQLEADKENDAVHKSVLEQVEATLAVRMHLENLKKMERELAEEEMALNDEKGAHIRALKRVASEDASRFRSRPKVCAVWIPSRDYSRKYMSTLSYSSHIITLLLALLLLSLYFSFTTATFCIVSWERAAFPKFGVHTT